MQKILSLLSTFLIGNLSVHGNDNLERSEIQESNQSKVIENSLTWNEFIFNSETEKTFWNATIDWTNIEKIPNFPRSSTGEKIDQKRMKEFSDLASINGWRKILSNFYVEPFDLDGHKWNSVEHFYHAQKFKKGNPEFYLKFSLDSNSEISQDPVLAKAAGGKTGKFKGKLIRPRDIIMDEDFFSSGSLEKAKETFAMDAVLIGTDEDEYLSGWSEVEPSLIGQIAAIKDPVFTNRNLNIVMGDDGKMASYTQIVDFTFDSDGQTVEITNVRSSGVVKKYDGKWKIAQIHWSVGVQGQVIEYEYE